MAGRISRSVAGMEKDEQTGMDPAAAGRFIADVALKNSRKPLYTIGFAYKGAVFPHQNIARALAERTHWHDLRKVTVPHTPAQTGVFFYAPSLAAEGREPQESLRVPGYSIFKVLVRGRPR